MNNVYGYLARFIGSFLFFCIVLFIVWSVSKGVFEHDLSKKLVHQIEKDLDASLFSSSDSKADIKSIKFYIRRFNSQSDENDFSLNNNFQFIQPKKIELVSVDNISADKAKLIDNNKYLSVFNSVLSRLGSDWLRLIESENKDIQLVSSSMVKLEVQNTKREVVYYYVHGHNDSVLILYLLLSALMVYLFVFKRIPF